MNEDRKPEVVMKKEVRRNPSHTAILLIAAVLIAIAVAGIVLSGRKAADNGSSTAAPASAVSPTSAASATLAAPSVPTAPDEVIFAAGSDKMPPGAADTVARFVQTVRTEGKTIRISARYLTGADKAQAFELAKARATAVRHAVVADGMTGDKIRVELVEVPAGALTERDSNRVQLISS